jgi:predicted branched-subunit amino acid permease
MKAAQGPSPRNRQDVMRDFYLAILVVLVAIPLTLLFGSKATRSDRLFGMWIGIGISLLVYGTAVVVSLYW